MQPDVPRLVRRSATFALASAALCSMAAFAAADEEWALGIALGALLGLLNYLFLARALARILGNLDAHRPYDPQTRVLPRILIVKWPLILLALAGILWYMPARPEGVAIGLIVSLAAVSLAARPRRTDAATPLPPPT